MNASSCRAENNPTVVVPSNECRLIVVGADNETFSSAHLGNPRRSEVENCASRLIRFANVCLASQMPLRSRLEPDANQFAQDVFHNKSMHNTAIFIVELPRFEGENETSPRGAKKDGEIDRLLAVNGQKLNPKQRQAEDQRIHRMLNHPDQMRKKQKKQHEDARQAEKLMQMFPDAFRFQYYGLEGSLIKLKFKPNPNFHPSGHAAQVFQHLQGSLTCRSPAKAPSGNQRPTDERGGIPGRFFGASRQGRHISGEAAGRGFGTLGVDNPRCRDERKGALL